MPDLLESALGRSAAKKGLTGKQAKSYVFGTMNKMKVMNGSQMTPKGAAMQKKHDKDMAGARLKSSLLGS